ncbi:MAG TPA: diaminopimelate decarboxylase [Gemmatimonadales bacterium]|nr:diaminopimelate decarboxylase [Gemmatimonadales bacterium]
MGEGVLSGRAAAGQRGSGTASPTELLFADAGLVRRGSGLYLGDVSLTDIAKEVGTPAYVYNAEAIRGRYRALDGALGSLPHRICFAVKANSNLGILRILRDLGAGADIVSSGELARALAAGFAPEQIVFSGVGKTAEELRSAIRAGVGHLNVESWEELELVGRIAEAEATQVRVGIRVNPDVTTETHPYISTGKSGIKFGVPTDQVVTAAEYILAHPRLELTTVAMHLGSQLVDTAPFRQGIARLIDLVERLRKAGVGTLQVLDIGGGLGIRYSDERAMEPDEFADAVVPLLGPTSLKIYLEPGRFLVGSAGLLLTRVLYRKHSGGKEFVVVDAGMNDLVRPSHYQAYHEIVELVGQGRPSARVDVVGPVCETGDFLALDRTLPGLEAGDALALLGAGAYGFVMASNYNSRPRPPEVIVDGGTWWIAREREKLEDLFATERLSP